MAVPSAGAAIGNGFITTGANAPDQRSRGSGELRLADRPGGARSVTAITSGTGTGGPAVERETSGSRNSMGTRGLRGSCGWEPSWQPCRVGARTAPWLSERLAFSGATLQEPGLPPAQGRRV